MDPFCPLAIHSLAAGDAAQGTLDVGDHAAREHGMTAAEIERGMAEKAAEFRAQGAEIYRPA